MADLVKAEQNFVVACFANTFFILPRVFLFDVITVKWAFNVEYIAITWGEKKKPYVHRYAHYIPTESTTLERKLQRVCRIYVPTQNLRQYLLIKTYDRTAFAEKYPRRITVRKRAPNFLVIKFSTLLSYYIEGRLNEFSIFQTDLFRILCVSSASY